MNFIFVGQNEIGGSALSVLIDKGRVPSLIVTRVDKNHDNAVIQSVTRRGLEARIIKTSTVISTQIFSAFKNAHPKVAFCCGWSERLTDIVLSIPEFGWVNLHPSMLPAWKGSNPIGWQLATGARQIGCSAHVMTSKLDDGPLLESKFIDVSPELDGLKARRLAGSALGDLACAVLSSIERDDVIKGTLQDEHCETKCPPIGVHPLLETAVMSCDQVVRIIRAFEPFPGVAIHGLPTIVRTISVEITSPLLSYDTPGMVQWESIEESIAKI